MSIVFQTYTAPLGPLLLAARGDTLVVVDLAADEASMQASLRRRFPDEPTARGQISGAVTRALDAYFAGDLRAVDTGGTEFHRQVWAALRTIPAGQTTSYGALARALGRPTASRAVGMANGANPVAIVVPCHRVIGSDGSLTGYAGGLPMKRWLLEHEGWLRRPETSGAPIGLDRTDLAWPIPARSRHAPNRSAL